MRFSPTGFIGAQQVTANSYWDAENPASLQNNSNVWYNIGLDSLLYSPIEMNLTITSSLYKSEVGSGSYYEITSSQGLGPVGGGSSYIWKVNTNTTFIYKIDLWDQVGSGIKFYGNTSGNSNILQSGVSSSFFGASAGMGAGYASPLSANISGSILAGQFNYIAVYQTYTGGVGGQGNTIYYTSLDNFATAYQTNFTPGNGIGVQAGSLSFIGIGVGKIKSIATYDRQLNQNELIQYTQIGPYI